MRSKRTPRSGSSSSGKRRRHWKRADILFSGLPADWPYQPQVDTASAPASGNGRREPADGAEAIKGANRPGSR